MFEYFANLSDMEVSLTEKGGRYKVMKEKEMNIFEDIKEKLTGLINLSYLSVHRENTLKVDNYRERDTPINSIDLKFKSLDIIFFKLIGLTYRLLK